MKIMVNMNIKIIILLSTIFLLGGLGLSQVTGNIDEFPLTIGSVSVERMFSDSNNEYINVVWKIKINNRFMNRLENMSGVFQKSCCLNV